MLRFKLGSSFVPSATGFWNKLWPPWSMATGESVIRILLCVCVWSGEEFHTNTVGARYWKKYYTSLSKIAMPHITWLLPEESNELHYSLRSGVSFMLLHGSIAASCVCVCVCVCVCMCCLCRCFVEFEAVLATVEGSFQHMQSVFVSPAVKSGFTPRGVMGLQESRMQFICNANTA